MKSDSPEPGPAAHGGETVLLRHRAGILLAGIVLSFGGLLIRMIETATPWQILLYRSGFLALSLALYLAWRERERLVQYLAATSGAAILGGFCIGGAMIGFIWSVTHTTVANTLFILAASPFVAAALGWIALRERVHARTWLTMVVAALGIGVMVYDGIGGGHITGLLAALGATFGFAGLTVILRWKRHADLMAAVLYGAIFSSLVGAVVTLPEGFAVPLADVGWCVFYGGPVMVLGFILLIHGGRFVPAAEVTLLSLSEVALGPVWVWLVVDERPSGASLIGGTLVLAAVAAQVLLGGRRRHPPMPLD